MDKKIILSQLKTMKKILIIAISITLLLFSSYKVYASSMADSLSGRILLQVQGNGESWYVNPNNNQRYYMGRPDDAFSLMRSLGLGIKNSELNSYLNSSFPSRLSGKILLDVEKNGEAYYVYPVNLKGYYLGRPVDAFSVMRNLGLGITNANLNLITIALGPTIVGSSSGSNQIANTNSFVFAVQADPHMDEQSDANVYKQTLRNIVAVKPAFLVDLGDIFMVDKQTDKSEANIESRYVLMKSYYDILGSTPFYFAMGNHDGEVGWDTLYTKKYRSSYFPDETYDKNYYSFEKNNALFIVLDPYSYTTTKPNSNGWLWTLGKPQYDWLKATLENSDAKYKFVFIHQLVGGDNQGRGGIEFAKYYEWGGNNLDGSYGFDTYRAGWGKPIHQLLIDNKVNVVFKGHDHFYAKQDLDGVVYQTVPQPSHPGDKVDTATEYGYNNGEVLGGSGFLNVKVSDSGATVEFLKTSVGNSAVTVDSYVIN